MACYLSTPFLIFPILKGASRVIFTNFLNAHLYIVGYTCMIYI